MATWQFWYLRQLRGKLSAHLAAGEAEPELQMELQVILAEVRLQLTRLPLPEYLKNLPSMGNRHNVFLAAVTIAAYRAFLVLGVSKSSAVNSIRILGWEMYAQQIGLASAPWRMASRSAAVRLRGTITSLLRFPFSSTSFPGYEVKVWREGKDLHTNWTSCAPLNFIRYLLKHDGDHGELAMFRDTWCTYDWAAADLIANDGRIGHYERTQTLSAGDDVCDMVWIAVPAPAESRCQENIHG